RHGRRDRDRHDGALRPQGLSGALEGVRGGQLRTGSQQSPYLSLVGRAPAPAVDARCGVPDVPRRDLAPSRRGECGNASVQAPRAERAGRDHRVPEVLVSTSASPTLSTAPSWRTTYLPWPLLARSPSCGAANRARP